MIKHTTFRLKRFFRRLISSVRANSATPKLPVETQLRMIYLFNNFKITKNLQLPPGYQLMYYQPRYKKEWMEFLNHSGEFITFNEVTFQEEVLSGLISAGGILIQLGGEIVACSAVCEKKKVAPYALLMYVYVSPMHRGKGLGKAISVKSMEAAYKAGYPGIVLYTDDFRLPAIKTYLAIGFRPDDQATPEAGAKWEQVLQTLSSSSKKQP